MTWAVEWHPVVLHDVRAMHWRTAGEACAAVLQFAATGRGQVEVIGRGRFALRTPGAVAFFDADVATLTLRVRRILPSG